MTIPTTASPSACSGHDVLAVAATPSLRGTSDDDLLAYAAAQQLVIVTENVVDVAAIATRWATEGRAHAGLIFTNPKRFNRATLAYPGSLVVALHGLLADPPEIGASGTWWL